MSGEQMHTEYEIILCDKCKGTGVYKLYEQICDKCNGTGRLFKIKKWSEIIEPFDLSRHIDKNIRHKLSEKNKNH